jgi:hypothetical protein
MAMTTKAEEAKRDEMGVAVPYDEVEETLKADPSSRDYSGAKAKTDPREIALVRKLDWWIMPILWAMYWLNYLVRRRF